MQIKICGLTEPRDAELALELGASHLGCVVAPQSPRSTSAAARRTIRELTRGRARFVLVVKGIDLQAVRALCRDCEPDLVQWHGLPAAAEVALANELPLLRVRQIAAAAPALPRVDASADRPVVFDGGSGGAGQRFAWSLLGGGAPAHTFIAGGITPQCLPELLGFAPAGIDVCSGIEAAPGRKDSNKMRALFAGLEIKR